MPTFHQILAQNSQLSKWFNMLNQYEKQYLVPIFDQIIKTTEFYESHFQGFQIYITGSSLNYVKRSYNDIDFMIVLPVEELKNAKLRLLVNTEEMFKNNNQFGITEQLNDPGIKIFRLTEVLNSVLGFMLYTSEITTANKNALTQRHGSTMEANRILMDPEKELNAIKVRVEGMLEEEKPKPPVESDGSAGYEYGTLVEEFLKTVASKLGGQTLDGQPMFYFQWHKSFSEGYGKTAGENNCYIYPRVQCTPVHLFMTTGVDQKKAMEKKDSFMIAYYSAHERMPPIKIF